MASSAVYMTMLLLCTAVLLLTAHAAGEHPGKGGEHKGKGDLVHQVCQGVSSRHGLDLSPGFCSEMLRSDKRSEGAKNSRELTLIAIDLVQRTTADAHAKVQQQLSQNKKNSHTEASLQKCHSDYASVAQTVPVCRSLVQENKPGHECSKKLSSASKDCQDHVYVLIKDNNMRKALWTDVMKVYHRSILVEALMYEITPSGGHH